MRLLHASLRTVRAAWSGAGRRPGRRGAPRRRSAPLTLTLLERRDNPSIPIGLTDVHPLGGPPIPIEMPEGDTFTYSETHSLTQNETNTVTVDESGTGSSGTFSIDVVGSAHSADSASGSGSGGNASVSKGGTGNSQFSYHLTMSGTYDSGSFTVTSETYTETGSYSTSDNGTWTFTSDQGSSTYHWDDTASGNYSLSWSAAESGGQLQYTSYSLDETDTAHWHTHTTSPDGSYTDSTWDASSTVHTSGSGYSADYTGTNSWHEHHYSYYANPGGTPYDYTYDYGYTNPVSGTTYLGLYEGIYMPWEAGTSDATGFTFHGSSSEASTLTETATFHTADSSGSSFDVNSFSSTYHSSDSGHVVDDEPGVPDSGGDLGGDLGGPGGNPGGDPGSGSDLFHRDESFNATDDLTGSGSYVGGSGNADYHAVETGSYDVANSYTSTGEESFGYDDDGEPFDLVFNFHRDGTGSGSLTQVHDYHDSGLGLALSGESFSGSGSNLINSHIWGSRNGVPFDETSTTPGSWGSSFSLPGGGPAVVAPPDGAVGAFPLVGMTTPNMVFFTSDWPQNLPTTPVRGKPGQIQDWYNRKVMEIGEAAKKKVTNLDVKQAVLWEINNTPFGIWPRASGTFTYDEGWTFVIGLGRDSEVSKDQKKWEKTFKELGYTDVKLTATKAEITYAVDMTPSPDPTKLRSGNVVATYKIILYFTAKNKAGTPIAPVRDSIQGTVLIHDGKIETMRIDP
jgi:hypothetical protein